VGSDLSMLYRGGNIPLTPDEILRGTRAKEVTGFLTKDSGAREEYDSGMVRDTQEDKARFDLMRPKGIPYEAQFLTRVAQLMTRGAKKYGFRNWENANSVEELERFENSAERHMQQYLAGERDEDHAAAVVFNILAAETLRYKLEG
jgi:Domain of unknown function (DUF5664)